MPEAEVNRAVLEVLSAWLLRASASPDAVVALTKIMEAEREKAVEEIINKVAQNKDGRSIFATA